MADRNRFFIPILVALLVFGVFGRAESTVFYGNKSGTSVDFNNIRETTQTDDPEPLFGEPQVIGNNLLFTPQTFSSYSDTEAGDDNTAGLLSLSLVAKPGTYLETIRITEYGDYTLLSGEGGAASAKLYGALFITPILPFYAPISTDYVLDYEVVADDSANGIFTASWFIDLKALGYTNVERAEISFNNDLQTVTEGDATAFIQKKVTYSDTPTIIIQINEVPLPGAVLLIVSGIAGLLGIRKYNAG